MKTVRLWLCLAIILLSAKAGTAAAEKAPAPPEFEPGKETTIPWPGLAHELVVYTPTNYDAQKSWPVIFYYHGMDEKPGAKLLRHYTKGKDFIIVGMTYASESDTAQPQNDLAIYRHVRRWLLHHLKIDNNRVYMAGTSQGGWQTSRLGEKDMQNLAGLIIVLAGRRWTQVPAEDESAFLGKPVYIGVGETDANNSFAQRAKVYYRKCGARVSFEEYKGKGHEIAMDSGLLADWLEVQGRLSENSTETTNALAEWVKIELAAVEKERDPSKQYSMLSMLKVNPKILKCSGKDIARLADSWNKVLAQSQDAVREWKAEQAFDKDVEIELAWVEQKRKSATGLKRVYSSYFGTSKAYPTTRYGQLASDACKRIEPMIKSYEEQVRNLRRKTKPTPGEKQPRLEWNGGMGQ